MVVSDLVTDQLEDFKIEVLQGANMAGQCF